MSDRRFKIDFNWDEDRPQGTAFEATSGKAVLRLGSSVIWGKPSNDSCNGIHWTWVDLLAFLAENWVALLNEPVPSAFSADFDRAPHLLRRKIEQRWALELRAGVLSEAQHLKKEEELFYFEERHDLSRGIPGKTVPDLFVLRESNGSGFIVSSSVGPTESLTADEVIVCLENAGNEICSRLEHLNDPVAVTRCAEWRARWPALDLSWVCLSTGASADYLSEIADDSDPAQFWGEGNSAFTDSLVMALARMGVGARLSPYSVKEILRLANSNRTPLGKKLDVLRNEVASWQQANFQEPEPADQGRLLAGWFRKRQNLTNAKQVVDPRRLIEALEVKIIESNLSEAGVDAISCWRPSEQPTVILNMNSVRNRRVSGVRAALAHELCHLIVDNDRKVPFAEVVRGDSHEGIEKRARGFAAELLMPRAEIVRSFEKSKPMALFLDELSRCFDVSHEIIVWQIRRSELFEGLSEENIETLRRFVTNPQDLDG
ncbi:MAG: ImmA/IrrE family metallo-endopeptidase [Rhodospirillales bacterium]|nr:ImmA/IrrE family metallo-endopeptidase [Rhodospirillales bacterium]